MTLLFLAVAMATAVFWVDRIIPKHWNLGRSAPRPTTPTFSDPDHVAVGSPLPPHFPSQNLEPVNGPRVFVTLREAVATCWPDRAAHLAPSADDETVTVASLEAIFGTAMNREVLREWTDGGPVAAAMGPDAVGPWPLASQIGFLFERSPLGEGGAGSVVESGGQVHQVRVRVAGRLLQCLDSHRCECL